GSEPFALCASDLYTVTILLEDSFFEHRRTNHMSHCALFADDNLGQSACCRMALDSVSRVRNRDLHFHLIVGLGGQWNTATEGGESDCSYCDREYQRTNWVDGALHSPSFN